MRISDWSSDVGSSDLSKRRGRGLCRFCRVVMAELAQGFQARPGTKRILAGRLLADDEPIGLRRIDEQVLSLQALAAQQRSEERRVGKDCVRTCKSRR